MATKAQREGDGDEGGPSGSRTASAVRHDAGLAVPWRRAGQGDRSREARCGVVRAGAISWGRRGGGGRGRGVHGRSFSWPPASGRRPVGIGVGTGPCSGPARGRARPGPAHGSTGSGAGAGFHPAHMAREGARPPAAPVAGAAVGAFAAVVGLLGGVAGLVHAPAVADAVVLCRRGRRVAVGRARASWSCGAVRATGSALSDRRRRGALPDLRPRGTRGSRAGCRACPTRWCLSRSSRARGCGGTCPWRCSCCISRTGGCPVRGGGGSPPGCPPSPWCSCCWSPGIPRRSPCRTRPRRTPWAPGRPPPHPR
jgi:hypothetical protein